jgi:hypothetical protein
VLAALCPQVDAAAISALSQPFFDAAAPPPTYALLGALPCTHTPALHRQRGQLSRASGVLPASATALLLLLRLPPTHPLLCVAANVQATSCT